jgi:hypothetical protein
LVPEKICSGVRFDGGTAAKIWIKTRKIVGPAVLLLNCTQVFTRVEGGIGGPNPPYDALGSPVKMANRHGTSFIKFKFNPRVCFLRLLFTQSYGPPSYVKQILSGVKNLNDSI